MEQQEIFMQKRLVDLSRSAAQKNIVTFSNFLNLNELNLFHQAADKMETACQLSGGYEHAERQMIAFIPDALYYAQTRTWDFPISCLMVSPVNAKFADELTHRDILGAIMSLGIERNRIGDIQSDGQNCFYIFCEERILDYLSDSLKKIRHTNVRGQRIEKGIDSIERKLKQLDGIVASCRLDNIISFLTAQSRSKSALLIQSQKVFINSRISSSNSYECKPGDVISIRGFGKYIYIGSSGETKKGRKKITVQQYL